MDSSLSVTILFIFDGELEVTKCDLKCKVNTFKNTTSKSVSFLRCVFFKVTICDLKES